MKIQLRLTEFLRRVFPSIMYTNKGTLPFSKYSSKTSSNKSDSPLPGESISSIPLRRSSCFNPTSTVASNAFALSLSWSETTTSSLGIVFPFSGVFRPTSTPSDRRRMAYGTSAYLILTILAVHGFSCTGKELCRRSSLMMELFPQFLSPMKNTEGLLLSSLSTSSSWEKGINVFVSSASVEPMSMLPKISWKQVEVRLNSDVVRSL